MADQPDLPMNTSGGAEPKSPFKSKTIWFIIGAGVIGILSNLAASQPGWEWAAEPLTQLQLFLLGGAGMSRAVASGPLK